MDEGFDLMSWMSSGQTITVSYVGDLSRFWDGYDNQPLVWIDNPVSPSVLRTGDEEPLQCLKTIISTREILVEVKHRSMVFDSNLIIISCNIHPNELATTCGEENRATMFQRFTDTYGAHYIGTQRHKEKEETVYSRTLS